MAITYEVDESAAVHADDVANRIDTSGAYVGQFKKVWAVISSEKGTHGVKFAFDSPGNGEAELALWVEDADGKRLFGANLLNAIQYLLGVKRLESVPGKVLEWDEEAKERVEVDGEEFPQLCGKDIGLVLQKEINSKRSGGETFRMSIYGTFHAKSNLTMSEMKEGKTQPTKKARMLRGLKDKDNRKKNGAEPGFETGGDGGEGVGAGGGY